MTRALLYLGWRSARNLLVSRLRRLRRPRYLVFAVVGFVYIWFFVLRHWMRGFSMAAAADAGLSLPPGLVEIAAAVAVLLVTVVAWCLPTPAAPLPFSEAEIQFLFPAPLSRSGLVRWKLVKGQAGVLVSSLIFTAVSAQFLARGAVATYFAGVWIAFLTMHLHLVGVRMARHRLAARGIGWAPRTTVALAFAVLVIGGPALWAWRSVGPPPSPADDVAAVEALGEWAASMAAAGPVRLLLQIPRILVRPALAQGAGAFLAALLPAVVLVVVNERWVLRSAVSLQEGALDEARHRAGRRQARSQRRAGRPSGYTPLPAPVALSPAGRPETALMWKSLIQVTRSLGWRGSLRLTIVVAAVVAMVVVNARRHEAVGILLGVICGAIAMILLIAGPRLLRSDFSQELLHIDLLRSYPVSGRSLVIGTLLAPVAIVTVLQWVMTLGVVLFAGGVLEGRGLPPFTVAAGALAAAILMPAMNLVGAILHNAAILLLPGWVGIGSARGAGIEVLGQRIITGVGRILALLITFLPAAAVFAAALFVLTLFAPLTVALPLAAAPAALALGVEAAAGVLILGSVLDRFDPPTELDGWNP